MKNILWAILGVIVAGGGLWFAFGGSSFERTIEDAAQTADAAVVSPGTYAVDPAQSRFEWAGKKPLIDGYVDSGTIGVSEGAITVGESEASGSFTLDMNTLHVGLTAKKPGQEGALEGHLKGKGWFDVAAYPTAKFVITKVEPTAGSATTFEYAVTGDLTIKGITHEISFPARIFQTSDGLLHANAQTEIDRTEWGLTFGSGNFFDSLGDNLIADEVALSFSIVAAE
jgi:polyisoprenoid-binding protein YceI